MLGRRHARVGNDDRIAGQLRPVLPQKGRQAAAADLLFAFNDEGNIARQLGPGLEVSLHRFEVRQVLALVVARAAPVERAVDDARLEGRRLPQLQRFGRLHVVMPVNHEVRAARPFAFARGVLATTMGCPGVEQSRASKPICRQCFTTHSAHACISLRCCGWAETLGNRTILAEFADEARLVLLQIINDALHSQSCSMEGGRSKGKFGSATSSSSAQRIR